MPERRTLQRDRTLLGGKMVFNNGRSTIDCLVRNLSADGACVQVESTAGLPTEVHLAIGKDADLRACNIIWESANRVGLSFKQSEVSVQSTDAAGHAPELLRGELLALRASLDEVRFGIVLLDNELRAQFINRAFRKMWRLSDAKADSRPAFVALLYHGKDTCAYEVRDEEVDAYIAERVALIKAGNQTVDLRLANGEVVRLQCAVLPNGGRMLSYTYVTDIVRHSDELETLRTALDKIDDGVILLDAQLNAQFMNRAVRQLWKVPDEQAESRPSYARLVGDAKVTGTYGVSAEELESFIAGRIAAIRAGDPAPQDLRTSDGRHIRSRCSVLPSGGRMLTYSDVTDLVRTSEQLEKLATIDSLTGIYNRRHFLVLAEAEWSRFQRYHRPLSMLMVDVDHFKSVNDRFGHAVGDQTLSWVATVCQKDHRVSDIVSRIGGEEFALLLPETDLKQAAIVAERIRKTVAAQILTAPNGTFSVTVSIGIASATLSMSGIGTLVQASDEALYSAKAMGRDRVVEFEQTPSTELKIAAE